MIAPGPDGEPRPVVRASGWRMATLDTAAVAVGGIQESVPVRPMPGR